ncbi:hypothetical protein CANCADRAFT_135205 [Tortispora caseinolytica NRRL Y-17796]|uniref:Uncharacterized protein n=1 Tax=Tortispora caseinolytica NRRL Y-17796 TaxID=767744 RepID=A0A1E4TBS7_9ASCO|nr:hypothetical protein CANCADRAFT_135205 [Tortispora caseinolytica NRRL Y-17796]
MFSSQDSSDPMDEAVASSAMDTARRLQVSGENGKNTNSRLSVVSSEGNWGSIYDTGKRNCASDDDGSESSTDGVSSRDRWGADDNKDKPKNRSNLKQKLNNVQRFGRNSIKSYRDSFLNDKIQAKDHEQPSHPATLTQPQSHLQRHHTIQGVRLSSSVRPFSRTLQRISRELHLERAPADFEIKLEAAVTAAFREEEIFNEYSSPSPEAMSVSDGVLLNEADPPGNGSFKRRSAASDTIVNTAPSSPYLGSQITSSPEHSPGGMTLSDTSSSSNVSRSVNMKRRYSTDEYINKRQAVSPGSNRNSKVPLSVKVVKRLQDAKEDLSKMKL